MSDTDRSSAGGLFHAGNPPVTLFDDGRVVLSPDLKLDDVKGLGLPYLYFLREIVNTAIYDAENGR